MNKSHIHSLIADLDTALVMSKYPENSEMKKLSVGETGLPFVKLLEDTIPEKSKFEEVIGVLQEFLYKIVDLFFKGDSFKKPGFFKYITVAKTLIDLIVKVWKIFSK